MVFAPLVVDELHLISNYLCQFAREGQIPTSLTAFLQVGAFALMEYFGVVVCLAIPPF